MKIMACLESDISDLQIAKDIRDLNKTNLKPTEEIPQDSKYFDLDDRLDDLKSAHSFYFEFATQKVFF